MHSKVLSYLLEAVASVEAGEHWCSTAKHPVYSPVPPFPWCQFNSCYFSLTPALQLDDHGSIPFGLQDRVEGIWTSDSSKNI